MYMYINSILINLERERVKIVYFIITAAPSLWIAFPYAVSIALSGGPLETAEAIRPPGCDIFKKESPHIDKLNY